MHRSAWSERDLQWHDFWAWDNTRSVTLALLRGYRPASVTLDAATLESNGGGSALTSAIALVRAVGSTGKREWLRVRGCDRSQC